MIGREIMSRPFSLSLLLSTSYAHQGIGDNIVSTRYVYNSPSEDESISSTAPHEAVEDDDGDMVVQRKTQVFTRISILLL